MDVLTIIVIVTLMMLLNGALLGVMNSDLPERMQPAASSWRIGTLLISAGIVLLAVQRFYPPGFILPAANFAMTFGFIGYWRAMRQFYGLKDFWLMLLPVVAATAIVWWFAVMTPSLNVRVIAVSIIWAGIMLACAHTAWRQQSERALSQRALIVLFVFHALFMLFRAIYTALVWPDDISVLQAQHWLAMLTPVAIAVLPVIGTSAFLLLCSERLRRDWEYAASTDALTGLANRRTMTVQAKRLLETWQKHGTLLGVAVIDVDHFKSINDRFGHDAGDSALVSVAAALKSKIRSVDALCRWGGEEFVALFEIRNTQDLLNLAEQLRAQVQTLARAGRSQDVQITVSIGVAVPTSPQTNLDELLLRADRALYQAKSLGRNRVELG